MGEEVFSAIQLHAGAVSKALTAYMQALIREMPTEHDEAKAEFKEVLDAAIRAYLAELAAAGWKMVPAKASEQMVGVEMTPLLVAGSAENTRVRQWRDALWAAMHDAAPPWPPED